MAIDVHGFGLGCWLPTFWERIIMARHLEYKYINKVLFKINEMAWVGNSYTLKNLLRPSTICLPWSEGFVEAVENQPINSLENTGARLGQKCCSSLEIS
jgi:hypothetical protein